jgi:hypothetical protein
MKIRVLCFTLLTIALLAACANPSTVSNQSESSNAKAIVAVPVPVKNIEQVSSVAGSEDESQDAKNILKPTSFDCPATVPTKQLFVPPSPYPNVAPYGGFWFGSDKLWLSLHPDGKWQQLLHGDKMFWWSNGYEGTTEPTPALKLTGRQLDGEATFSSTDATNALHEDFGGWTILTGVRVPSAGCWEITGEYGGDKLTFVVQVDARP